MTLILPAILIFVLFFAMMPVVLQFGPDGNSIHLSWKTGFWHIKQYFSGIGTGDSFRFFIGKNEFNFWEEIGFYFRISFIYVIAGGLLGTFIGIFAGIYFAISNSRWMKSIVDLVGSLPDFILILMMQFAVVFIASETGIVIFEVATLTSDDPAIVLPIIAMVLVPANYMIRNVAMQMKLTLTEDYISNAKARGLSKSYIIFYHALPNVLPYIKGDLHKLMGILLGNLFIVEYLFNNNGISMLIFTNAFVDGYFQYDIIVNGLLSFMVLYGIGYAVLRVFLFLLGKVFQR
ncbi:ABC transporter permease subunit [Paenibacillus sp. GCM10027627]